MSGIETTVCTEDEEAVLSQLPDGSLGQYIEIRNALIEDLERITRLLLDDQQLQSGDELKQSIQDKIDKRLQRLVEDRLTIGVFGETCSGKSTIINALSKREVSRPDVLSNTGVIMEFTYAEQEELRVSFLDGTKKEVHWEDIPEYTDQFHNPENEKRVAKVHIKLPLSYLKHGIKFYDTPGLNDVIRSYSDLSSQFLNEMGAVIITSLYPPFTRGEIDFLKQASKQCGRLFIVINLSQDYWPQRERLKQRVIANITRDAELRNHPDLQPENIRIFVLNARDAWRAVEQHDTELLHSCGFQDFQTSLEQFLTQDASRTVLTTSIRSGFEVISLLQTLLSMHKQLLDTQQEEIEQKLREVQEMKRDVEVKKLELFGAVEQKLKKMIDSLKPEIEQMVTHTSNTLKQIHSLQNFAEMTAQLEDVYRKNLEHSARLEQTLSLRIEAIFDTTQQWLQEQIETFLSPPSGKQATQHSNRAFALSRAQKNLLGIFDGYDDQVGVAEAVVGVTTVGATIAAGGKGIALLSFLGPLAFPLGGAGGFIVGMFARNFIKVGQLKKHIEHQLKQLDDSQELLPDKLDVVVERIAKNIKEWIDDYFKQLFEHLEQLITTHKLQLSEESYLHNKQQHLAKRQADLDAMRDHFLKRLQDIQDLLQQPETT